VTGGEPEPVCETIPPERPVHGQNDKAAAGAQNPPDLAKYVSRTQHVFDDTGAHYDIGGGVAEHVAGFHVIHAK